jgi:flagellar basal-body rod protein FlgB
LRGGEVLLDKSFEKMKVMQKSLDAEWLRNKAISHNIANVNTPNYKREVVNFDDILKGYIEDDKATSLRKTNPMHMDVNGVTGLEPKITQVDDTSFREDGNNVNIDVEMTERAKMEIKYNSLVTQLNSEFLKLKMAIKGGR